MTAESTSASDKLVDALQTLDSEFSEVQLKYGCELQEQSILEDPASLPPHEEDLIHTQTNLALPVSDESATVQLQKSESEVQEEEKVQKFLSGTCKCHLGVENKPCSQSPDTIRKSRNSCSELSHNE